jgi:molybdopterin-synthase adenylyltransferase
MEIKSNDLYWQIAHRSFGVYSKEEQEKIGNAKIAIVGVGCNGGMDAYILARMGIGELRLVDFDINEISNMNRQPMATSSTIGIPKVYAAKMILQDINPTVKIDAVNLKLTEDNAKQLLQGYDVLIQGMDSMAGRIVFHREAKELGIPAITMTGQPPFRNFVSTIMPDGLTYEELFGIDFAIGKKFREHPELEKSIEKLKYERGKYAAKKGNSPEWLKQFKAGEVGWGITPERAYLTSVYQCHEAIALITGRKPNAVAPKAYISDLNGLREFGHPKSLVSILSPPNGKNWDYRMF